MIGKIISHYRILEELGRGGMGEVYLAEDTRLERQVALKFLPRHLTEDKESQLRFEREAKAAAALNHPNIVTVYEIGEHEGQVFIAMEYVEGQTLKEWISGDPSPSAPRPLPLAQILDIASQIASGLAAAHAKGIIHRDIKPQNILVEKDGRVKILDFGLAKLKGANPLTQESFAIGTVHYMSPEQGIGREVDPRSDIWSLGVVLYQLVSGELPFHGDYDQAVIYAIMNEDTPPLGMAALPGGAGVENIIRRCLAKKRQDRYPSAEALAKALRELAAAKEATRPKQRARPRLSRRAILTTIFLLLFSGLLGFLALNPKARAALGRALTISGMPRTRHMAVLPLHVSGGDAESSALADGLTAVIAGKLTLLEKFHDSIWTVPADDAFQNRGKPARSLQRLWGCTLFISGSLQAENNNLRLQLKLEDARSGRQLQGALLQGSMANLSLFQDGLLGKLLGLLGLPVDPAYSPYINAGGTSLPGAYILFLKGLGSLRDHENAAGIARGIGFLERALQQDGGYMQARLALAEALLARFKQSRDPDWLPKAVEQGRLAREDAGIWPPTELVWASLMKESGQKAEAAAAFQRALRADERCYKACIGLADGCMSAGRSSEAEALYKRAVRLRPGYPNALENLAFFYNANGRLDEALANYQKIAAIAPGDHVPLGNMGAIYMKKNERDKAFLMLEKANAIQPDPTVQSNLASLYFFEGNFRKALVLFQESAAKSNEHFLWGNLADTCRRLPDQAHKAGPAYRKAIGFAEKELQADPERYDLISSLALYYARVGEKEKALAAIARARFLAPTDLETIRREVLVSEAVQERSRALSALREYRERMGGLEEIVNEPDLAALRRDPAYQRLIDSRH